jgi:signal transduction histidine kinase
MAHDFNNLLQAVIGGIDLASTLAPPDTELSELINLALDSARQAGELSRQLVTLSDGWGATLRVGPLEPTLRAALATGQLTLCVELAPDLPPVPHDQELLRRAFVQLVENAREAMNGAGTLTIRGEVREIAEDELATLVAGAYVQLTFRDSGPGIAPEILPRIFQPYFSTKPRGATRGMGLGLSLCQAILQKHGGLVTATSPADGGALFTVLLPVNRPETEVYVR